ncbi:riboflavin synthase [Zunongwangia profunda]|uniref:Riboflavin synthase n=4 Tax=Zunongwangia profunda TaxID=398743 RepID=D5BDM0_ZUNPS|nr:riboflavin synthase [Zunongwangia profunda]ADF54926.1 riboflavin synthase subunit alpha [Zunongwangia profunda SM-A87]MAS72607.1 riboflavin synthase [Zunongwangia sp.]|tara:strand:+ start:5044 stop:5631 length:588 start_codon:yes stop_codon:yes gene_type:complete
MFTGIVEEVGKIRKLVKESTNLHIEIEAKMTPELKIDQSVSHNGVCLTVVSIKDHQYTVTAIQETLNKTNLNGLVEGDSVNLERGMKLGDRLDGHIVQGHVDQTAKCTDVQDIDGSWQFTFEYDPSLNNITIEKGSITINGVSLTVVNSGRNSFSVAIIPYTFENTTFKQIEKGSTVNLEFDVIGKYVKRITELS